MIRFYTQFLLFSVITVGIYFIFEEFASLKLNTADASTYLNIGENIVSHKGFVVSYNLYQSFTSLYRPIWPYMQSLYPLLCALVFKFHGGLEQVIKVNIFILGLNSALAFYIIQRFIPSRLNVFFLIWLAFSFNFYVSAFFAWTEEFHLFLFLISFVLFLRFPQNPRILGWVGVFNGVLFLVRVAQVYSILAYLLIICVTEDNVQEKLRNILNFSAGILAVVVPFQIFNWVAYHSLYPQYIKPAADYTLARISNLSTYRPGHVGIDNPIGFRFSVENCWYFYQHMMEFYNRIYLFLIPLLAYLSLPHQKKEGHFFVINCLCQSVFIITFYSYNFSWNTSIDSLRYSLIPYVLIAMAGWYALYQLFYASQIRWKKLLVVLILINLAFFSVCRYYFIRQYYLDHPRTKNPYYIDLYDSYKWIDQNLSENILVASNEDQEAFLMHRPFISTPPLRSYNCTNLTIYNSIYSPDYYLMSKVISDKCFVSIPHSTIFSNKIFRILKIKKEVH